MRAVMRAVDRHAFASGALAHEFRVGNSSSIQKTSAHFRFDETRGCRQDSTAESIARLDDCDISSRFRINSRCGESRYTCTDDDDIDCGFGHSRIRLLAPAGGMVG